LESTIASSDSPTARHQCGVTFLEDNRHYLVAKVLSLRGIRIRAASRRDRR